MTHAVDVLMTARELLDNPSHWVKKAFAVDANDRTVAILSKEACRFCLTAAITKAMANTGVYNGRSAEDVQVNFRVLELLSQAIEARGWDEESGVIGFNDHPFTTHRDILWALDHAIKAA